MTALARGLSNVRSPANLPSAVDPKLTLRKRTPDRSRAPFSATKLPVRRIDCLDCLQVQCARLGVVGARLVREPPADRWETVLVPRDRALFEANEITANFRLDLAVSLDRVERLHGAKKLHDEFLSGHAPKLAQYLLGDVKEGGRSDLAPKTVDFDW